MIKNVKHMSLVERMARENEIADKYRDVKQRTPKVNEAGNALSVNGGPEHRFTPSVRTDRASTVSIENMDKFVVCWVENHVAFGRVATVDGKSITYGAEVAFSIEGENNHGN